MLVGRWNPLWSVRTIQRSVVLVIGKGANVYFLGVASRNNSSSHWQHHEDLSLGLSFQLTKHCSDCIIEPILSCWTSQVFAIESKVQCLLLCVFLCMWTRQYPWAKVELDSTYFAAKVNVKNHWRNRMSGACIVVGNKSFSPFETWHLILETSLRHMRS